MRSKKKYFIPVFFSLVVITAFSFIGDNYSVYKLDGGPPYNTNAPGEKTCSGTEGVSPCHSGGIPDNSGPGTPLITFSGGSVYVPGQTYTVTVTINHPVSNVFGFQIVSLRDNNNMFTGSINLLDTARTRSQQPTWGSGQDRIFVMHRIAGTTPLTPNQGQWSYEWTAPSSNVGNISFYACMVAGNNNATSDPGDEVYWAKITIGVSAVGITNMDPVELSIRAFPNPASEYVQLNYSLKDPALLEAELIDMSGKHVQQLIEGVQVSATYGQKIYLAPSLAKGIYLVRSRINGKEYLEKLQVQ